MCLYNMLVHYTPECNARILQSLVDQPSDAYWSRARCSVIGTHDLDKRREVVRVSRVQSQMTQLCCTASQRISFS